MMVLQEMAVLLLQGGPTDWPSIAAMMTIVVGVSAVIAALINGMLIKPMIDKAKNEIMNKMISKESFQIFAENDRREHEDMKEQIQELSRNGRMHR